MSKEQDESAGWEKVGGSGGGEDKDNNKGGKGKGKADVKEKASKAATVGGGGGSRGGSKPSTGVAAAGGGGKGKDKGGDSRATSAASKGGDRKEAKEVVGEKEKNYCVYCKSFLILRNNNEIHSDKKGNKRTYPPDAEKFILAITEESCNSHSAQAIMKPKKEGNNALRQRLRSECLCPLLKMMEKCDNCNREGHTRSMCPELKENWAGSKDSSKKGGKPEENGASETDTSAKAKVVAKQTLDPNSYASKAKIASQAAVVAAEAPVVAVKVVAKSASEVSETPKASGGRSSSSSTPKLNKLKFKVEVREISQELLNHIATNFKDKLPGIIFPCETKEILNELEASLTQHGFASSSSV